MKNRRANLRSNCAFAAVLMLAGTWPSALRGQSEDEATVQAALESASALLQQGQPAQAIDALGSIEALEPDNPWLWYYRGKANQDLGNLYETLEAYDHAMDTLAGLGNPDPKLAERLRRDRAAVRRRLFRVSLQLGLAYDSNVTFRGAGTSVTAVSGRGDSRLATRLEIDHVPYINERESLTVGASLSHAWHDRIGDFNYQRYGTYVQYTRRLSGAWAAGLRYEYDLTFLGNQPFLSKHTVSPRLTYQWQPSSKRIHSSQTHLDYRIEARDYLFHTTGKFDRDGFTNSVGVAQHLQVRPFADRNWMWDVYAGYRLESVATEGSEFDRINHYFYAGLDFPLTSPIWPEKDLTCRLLASWEMAHYRHSSLIDRGARHRRDLITTLGIVLSQTLIDDPDRGDLILHGIFNWSDFDSNIVAMDGSQPFTYDKIIAGVQLEWRF